MIFEFLFNNNLLNRKPYVLVLVGFLYSSLSLLLSLLVFPSHASLVMVFLTVMACIPIVYNAIKHEEHEDIVLKEEVAVLKEHSKTLGKFLYLFLGFVFAFSLWFIIMPSELTHVAFESQLDTIQEINSPIDDAYESTLNAKVLQAGFPTFLSIMMNNSMVLIFCLVFSFIYGLGAIFILAWNASVIGAAIGSIIRSGLHQVSALVGPEKWFASFAVVLQGLLRFSIHGIPEITAYFIAGIAGGIISVAAIRHDFRSKQFKRIIVDAFDLAFIGLILIIGSAFIEVYLTPIFF